MFSEPIPYGQANCAIPHRLQGKKTTKKRTNRTEQTTQKQKKNPKKSTSRPNRKPDTFWSLNRGADVAGQPFVRPSTGYNPADPIQLVDAVNILSM